MMSLPADFFEEINISEDIDISSKEFEDRVIGTSIVKLQGFGYHSKLINLRVSLKYLSQQYGTSILHVLNQELNVNGWSLKEKTHWQKMRFSEYVEFVQFLYEVVTIGEKIFTPNKSISNQSPSLVHDTLKTMIFPHTSSAIFQNKFEFLCFLSSQDVIPHFLVKEKKIRIRHFALPSSFQNAYLFWPDIHLRDFRMINHNIKAPFNFHMSKSRPCHVYSVLDAVYEMCQNIIENSEFFIPSVEKIQDPDHISFDIFETNTGLKCCQVYGVGFYIIYVNIHLPVITTPHIMTSTAAIRRRCSTTKLYIKRKRNKNKKQKMKDFADIDSSVLPQDSIEEAESRLPLSLTYHDTSLSLPPLYRKQMNEWWCVPAPVAASGYSITGFQSELIYILRNAVTSAFCDEATILSMLQRRQRAAMCTTVSTNNAVEQSAMDSSSIADPINVNADEVIVGDTSLEPLELESIGALYADILEVLESTAIEEVPVISTPSTSDVIAPKVVDCSSINEEGSNEAGSGSMSLTHSSDDESSDDDWLSVYAASDVDECPERVDRGVISTRGDEQPSQLSRLLLLANTVIDASNGHVVASQLNPTVDIPVVDSPIACVSLDVHLEGATVNAKGMNVTQASEVIDEAHFSTPALIEEVPPHNADNKQLIEVNLFDDVLHYHRNLTGKTLKELQPLEQILSVALSGRVLFGSNIDAVGWTEYMQILATSFPSFLLFGSSTDVLALLRQEIEGMTTPQVYFKTPGVWTGGHEENCRFRSININMGPDPSEWYAIEPQYASELRQKVMERYKTDIYKEEGVWFPSAENLVELDIPFAYKLQYAGDCMVLDGATLHWVRALGFSFHFSWNFGVASFRQIDLAMDRYRENLRASTRNLVPMYTLVFDLAKDLLNDSSICGSQACSDLHLVGKVLNELTASSLDAHKMLTKAVKILRITPTPEVAGCMVLRCQQESCQKEIFGAYLSCYDCNLVCLECAVSVCKRGRVRKYLSSSCQHTEPQILIKDSVESMSECLSSLCAKFKAKGSLYPHMVNAKKALLSLQVPLPQIDSSSESTEMRSVDEPTETVPLTDSFVESVVDADTVTVRAYSHQVVGEILADRTPRVHVGAESAELSNLVVYSTASVNIPFGLTVGKSFDLPWDEKLKFLQIYVEVNKGHLPGLSSVVMTLDRPIYLGRAEFPLGVWLGSQRTNIKNRPSEKTCRERYAKLRALIPYSHPYFKDFHMSTKRITNENTSRSSKPAITTTSISSPTPVQDISQSTPSSSQISNTVQKKKRKLSELDIITPVPDKSTELVVTSSPSVPLLEDSSLMTAALMSHLGDSANSSLKTLRFAVESSVSQLSGLACLPEVTAATRAAAGANVEVLKEIQRLVGRLSDLPRV